MGKCEGRKLLLEYITEHPGEPRGEIADNCGLSLQQLGHLTSGRRKITSLAQAVHMEGALGIPIRSWV